MKRLTLLVLATVFFTFNHSYAQARKSSKAHEISMPVLKYILAQVLV